MKCIRFGVSLLLVSGFAAASAATAANETTPATPATDEPATSLTDSLKNGKAAVSLRYRFELVSDDARVKDAEASTLRTALSYRTAPYKHFTLFAEAENVAVVGDDDYNNLGAGSLANRRTDRPVVADPAITEINQAYLRFDNDTTRVTIGRQEVAIGDQRFVGAVGWRQNHQSFDGLTLEHRGVPKWTFSYTFLDSVHRIIGNSFDLTSHLADARFDWKGVGALTLYGYLLDFDNLSSQSTRTVGGELVGKRKVGNNLELLYEVELAQQTEGEGGPNTRDLDVGYQHLAFGGTCGKVTARIGVERLEGSRQGAFQTPLATLHKFNGWADRFLSTPSTGLEDLYLELSGKAATGLLWKAIYHDFSATEGGASYGEELDLLVSYKTDWNQTLALKGALYDADLFSLDTDKWMLWTAYAF